MRKNPRDLVDALLEYAVKFAESNDEPDTGACWGAIDDARTYLRKTATADSRRLGRADESQRARVLASLCSDGMTIGECMRALAAADDDPYVAAARAAVQADDNVEIDAETVTSPGDDGAWVLAWLWVGDGQAGVVRHSAMLEEVLNRARRTLACARGMDPEARRLLENQAAWLEDLLTSRAADIDAIGEARPTSEPGAIMWVDAQGRDTLFMPSDALQNLFELAKLSGLDMRHAEHCKWFRATHGRTLDAVLTVVRLG